MTDKIVYILMGFNSMDEKYIVAVFQIHRDAVQYADEWKIRSWHIYESILY